MIEQMIETFDGIKLYFRKDEQTAAKGVIVMVHGLCEHLGRYDAISEKFNEAGYSVYRFDHRGHGKSEGTKVFYSDFNEIIEDTKFFVDIAKKENPTLPIFLFGHSMGGYAVALYGTKYPNTLTGILMSGALTRNNGGFASELPLNLPLDTYIPNALGSGVCSDPKVVEAYDQDPLVEKEIGVGLVYSVFEGINWLKDKGNQFIDPVLIMHGANDGIIMEKDSRDFFGDIASKDKSLRIYANLFHEILNEPSRYEIVADMVQWMNKHLS